jgi:hypothetical protein
MLCSDEYILNSNLPIRSVRWVVELSEDSYSIPADEIDIN